MAATATWDRDIRSSRARSVLLPERHQLPAVREPRVHVVQPREGRVGSVLLDGRDYPAAEGWYRSPREPLAAGCEAPKEAPRRTQGENRGAWARSRGFLRGEH